jgi:hypothetical protein
MKVEILDLTKGRGGRRIGGRETLPDDRIAVWASFAGNAHLWKRQWQMGHSEA